MEWVYLFICVCHQTRGLTCSSTSKSDSEFVFLCSHYPIFLKLWYLLQLGTFKPLVTRFVALIIDILRCFILFFLYNPSFLQRGNFLYQCPFCLSRCLNFIDMRDIFSSIEFYDSYSCFSLLASSSVFRTLVFFIMIRIDFNLSFNPWSNEVEASF